MSNTRIIQTLLIAICVILSCILGILIHDVFNSHKRQANDSIVEFTEWYKSSFDNELIEQ